MLTGQHCTEESMEDIPMNRYTNPIPTCCPNRTGRCQFQEEACDRILTALACQNQILTDLLGAVNGLTAAILYDRKK